MEVSSMAKKVLVTYGSKYGSTAEIARRVGQVLEREGLAVEVKPTGQVTDLGSYDAVVLGSAIYMGQWRKEAAAFLEENQQVLAERPVWFFSSGPTGAGDAADQMKGWRLPEKLQPAAERVHPREIVTFSGKLDPGMLNLLEKLVLKLVKAPTGDFRDWSLIETWAAGIARELRA
jgi:menaquinone-dependent protoporphyrinogen oxidase